MADKRKQKGDRTRAQIINSARRFFQHQGYHATSMSQLIGDSGHPKGAIYFHFPEGRSEPGAEATSKPANKNLKKFAKLSY